MRRVALFSVFVIALPVAFFIALGGDGQAGPRSQLTSSWVDSSGTAHLSFDVRGVPTHDVLTAALILHRPASEPATAIHVQSGSWSQTVGWPTGTGSTNVISVNVSSAVAGNGPANFLVSNIKPAATPDVIVAPTAGSAAPALVLKASPAGSIDAAADSSKAATSDISAATSTQSGNGGWTTVDPGSAASSSSAGSSSPSWQSLWVDLVPPPPGSGSDAWVPAPSSGCGVSALLVPNCGVWWGFSAKPDAGQSWDQAMADFDTLQGRSSDLLHYYHVGATLFPTQTEINRAHAEGQNPVLLENWKPELGRTWAQVAAGDPAVDAEIDREAEYLKTGYTAKFFLAIHHEPENEIIPTAGSGFTAADYAGMYRHVVLRLRSDGVTNAVYVMNFMGSAKWGEQSWFKDLYPGDDVVDWIAEDPYSIGSSPPWRTDFAGMVDRRDGSSWPGFYTWATTNHPGKPIMLAEWGVTEDPSNAAAKANFFSGMLAELPQFPDIKALVYWNAPVSGGGTAIDSDPSALAAFKQLAASTEFHVQAG